MTTHATPPPTQAPAQPAKPKAAPPTPEDARKFVDDAENRLLDLWIKDGRAQWVHETYITDDTGQMAADADQVVAETPPDPAAKSRRFDGLKPPPDVARKFMLLRLSVTIPTPRDPKLAAELSQINTALD